MDLAISELCYGFNACRPSGGFKLEPCSSIMRKGKLPLHFWAALVTNTLDNNASYARGATLLIFLPGCVSMRFRNRPILMGFSNLTHNEGLNVKLDP